LLPTLIWIPDSLLWHDYENTDIFCSQIAKRANLQVIAVYYRVAPENKYPTAYEDVCGALKLITSSTEIFQIKKEKIALGGNSSGACLAIQATLYAKEQGITILYQPLVSLMGDLSNTIGKNEKYKKFEEFEKKR